MTGCRRVEGDEGELDLESGRIGSGPAWLGLRVGLGLVSVGQGLASLGRVIGGSDQGLGQWVGFELAWAGSDCIWAEGVGLDLSWVRAAGPWAVWVEVG